jgi:uncharacterized protein (DUF697 family)
LEGEQVTNDSETLVQEETVEDTASVQEPTTAEDLAVKLEKASEIVRRKMLWSAGVGLIPVPVVDAAAFLGLQLYMIKQICDVFDVPFKKSWIKNTVGSLLGSILPAGLASPLAVGLRYIPVIGQTTSALAFSGLGAAATYAVGKVFTHHFAQGGTLLTIDSAKLKENFKKHFKEGQEVVEESTTGSAEATAAA